MARCERCGSTEHVQKHHMVYGSQIVTTILYLCCGCHRYLKEQRYSQNILAKQSNVRPVQS
jgi:hypothetical protein